MQHGRAIHVEASVHERRQGATRPAFPCGWYNTGKHMDESTSRAPIRRPEGGELTSFHVRRACDGEQESLAWVITRFTPLLLLQANYRLRHPLRRLCDPEDLVDDVWAVTLPRMGALDERDGRLTPVLLKFLSTTLLQRTNQLLKKHLQRSSESLATSIRECMPVEVTGVRTKTERDEASRMLHAALAELEAHEREVLVLRGIEQVSNDEVSRLLGVTPGAVTQRYQKALGRLRRRLPGSLFDELPEG